MLRLIKIIGVLGVVVVLALGGVGLLIRSQLKEENLKALVAENADKMIGRNVTFDSVHIDWKGAISILNLKVSDAAGENDQIKVGKIDVSLALSQILSGTIALSTIKVSEPWFRITKKRDGSHDFQDVLDKLQKKDEAENTDAGVGETSTGTSGGSSAASALAMILPHLTLENGSAEIIDEATGTTQKIQDLDVYAALSLSGPINFTAHLMADGKGLDAKGAFELATKTLRLESAQATLPSPPVKLALGAAILSLTDSGPVLEPCAVTINGNSGTVGFQLLKGAVDAVVKFDRIDLSQVDPARLAGFVVVNATVKGTPEAPQVSGGLSFDGVKIRPPDSIHEVLIPKGSIKLAQASVVSGKFSALARFEGIDVKVPTISPPIVARIESGAVKLSSDSVKSQDLKLKVMGMPLTPSFEVTGLPVNPQIQFDSGAIEAQLEKLADLLPPENQEAYRAAGLSGSISGGVKVTSDTKSRQISGGLKFGKIAMTPKDSEPMSFGPGNLSFKDTELELSPTPVRQGDQMFTVRAKVSDIFLDPKVDARIEAAGVNLAARGLIQKAPAPSFSGFTIDGQVEPGAFLKKPEMFGTARVDMNLTGAVADPQINGVVTSQAIGMSTAGGGKVAVTNIKADVAGGKSGITVEPIKALFADGTIDGSAKAGGTAPPRFDFKVAGVTMSRLLQDAAGSGDMMSGQLNFSFKGEGTAETLEGQGNASIKDFVITIGQSRAMAMMGVGLKAGETGSNFLAQQAGSNLMGKIFQAGGQSAGFFQAVVNILAEPIQMGTFETPLSAKQGVFTVGRFDVPTMAGLVNIDLKNDMALSGTIERIVLGRLKVTDVGLSGAVTAPVPKLGLKNISLDGQSAPLGMQALGELGSVDGIKQAAEAKLKEELQKKAGDALGGMLGGEKTGNPLGGLLGGGKTGEAAPGGVGNVLDAFTGDNKTPPAVPGAEPAKADPVKEVGKNLLKGLFK